MRTPRRRRASRPACLDPTHRRIDTCCPWCDNRPNPDPLLAAAERLRVQLLAEDRDGFGWAA
jgi:hypothetical protein